MNPTLFSKPPLASRIWAPLCLLLLALLSGCQSTPHKIPGAAEQLQHLYEVADWEVEGKIAITLGNDRENASFKWSQERENYVIHLFGPFGQGGTWLRRTDRGVILENAKTGIKHARSAEALMQEVLGWQVPVSNLQYWLRGLPAPKPTPSQLEPDTSGHLLRLQQQGWRVDYSAYQDFHGWWLPTKINAERDDLRIRLVIKQWQLPTAPVF